MSALDELMSSPPRSRAFAATNLSSSSPYLPSLEEIFAKKRAKISPKNSPKKPPFKAGNPAPRIPVDDRTTLTSAAGILREAPEIDIDTENITVSPSRGGKPANTRKPKASTPENFRTYDASNQAAILIESSSPTDKPWQKYKKPPSAQDDEPALPINRKPAATKKRSVNVSDTVSRHFGKTKEDPFVEDATRLDRVSGARDKVDGVLANIEQETAIPRRGDWTPPAAKQPIVLDSDSDARELFSSVDRIPVSKDVFQKLYDEFGRQEVDPAPGLPLQGASEVFRKRKLIEFVSTGQKQEKEQSVETPLLEDLQRPPQPERAKAKVPAPRKKTRTITELATAPFAAPISPELNLAGPDTEESMLKYFDSDGAVKALVEHQTMMMTQRTSKGKATKQPSKTTRRKKAGTQDHPILLSPSSALKQSSNQDFVFGTSSQLIEEQSPTTLKDLQIAIRASNRRDADPFHDDLGRRLWQAGARDENGKLMGLSSVDSRVGFESTGNDLTITPDAQSFVDIDDLLDSPVPVGLTACISGESLPTNPRFARPHKSNHESNIASGAGESASATPVEPRPKYELFTDAQLCGQLTSYGFKPIKKRSAMIALLDQCWKSQNPGASAGVIQTSSISTYSATRALQETSGGSTNQAAPKPKSRARTRTTEAEKNSVTQSTTSDKAIPKQPRVRRKKTEEKPDPMIGSSIPGPSAPKPRGRPKKSKRARGGPRKSRVASTEILDSANATPSPGSSASLVFSSPPPLDLTMTEDGDMSLAVPLSDHQAELFRYITKAVTSAPNSKDPAKPSWYEKMLLYDPIVIEELTSWLNAGKLTHAGYDGEVSPYDVKQWCESKSVICLWRHTTKGKERKRY
ncbi:hypothetical protein GGR50DRAFT_687999 [Xylaria sp. CBS 124048]|nr:hypothetical protein GGR50DRAFT_687999 [Xylaria sp. CBS 124048]